MMSQELAEATPSRTKTLRFFNYTLAVQQLSLHLHKLEIEYKSISAQAEIPEHLTTRNRMPSIQQDPQPVDLSNNGKKRIVFIDQKMVIKNLKQKIKMLETAISQLTKGDGADNPLVAKQSDSISFLADSSNTPAQTNDLPSNAAYYFSKAKQAVIENNYFNALKWADIALQIDPQIFNQGESINLADSADIVQIITKKTATQDLLDQIKSSKIEYIRIESNPTNEYFIPLDKKPEFLECIKQYRSMFNLHERHNEPLLHIATRFGYASLVKHLIHSGTPIDHQTEDGQTAIMVAAYYGYENLITYLIDNGANFTHESKNEVTALLLAAQSGHFTAGNYIATRYSDLKLRAIHINNAAIYASALEDVNIIQYFIDLGADLNYRNSKGYNALHLAAINNNLSIARLLLEKGAIPNKTDINFENELTSAVEAESIDMVHLLLKFGADINFPGHFGDTPLKKSIILGYLDIMLALIQLGANLGIQSNNTILIEACTWDQLPIVRYLVEECQVSIDETNSIGQTALMKASFVGWIMLASYLLDHHADINKSTSAGWTAITYASQNGHRDIVALLLSHGATIQNLDKLDIRAEGIRILNEEMMKFAIKNSKIKPVAKIEFVEVMQEGNEVVASTKRDNHQSFIQIACSGYFYDRGAMLKAIFKADTNLNYKNESGSIIGVDSECINLTPEIRLHMTLITEQERYNSICQIYIRNSDIKIFFFDLNHASCSNLSYKIAKPRAKIARECSIKALCLIGIYRENNLNQEALNIFKQFQAEESIEHSLICEFSTQGKRELKEFMLSLLSKIGLVNEGKISQSGNNTVAGEDNVEPKKSTCILQ